MIQALFRHQSPCYTALVLFFFVFSAMAAPCPVCHHDPCTCHGGGGKKRGGGGGGIGIGINIDLSTIGKKKKEDDPFASTPEDPPPVHRPTPTPTPPPNPRIVDIHPVQVVQDPPHEAPTENIPLVQNKHTMVRVFVELPPELPHLPKVTCVLRWNGQEVRQTADLERVDGRTYVFGEVDATVMGPGGQAANDRSKTLRHLLDEAQGRTEPDKDENGQPYPRTTMTQARNALLSERDYFWAYNFESPFLPEEGKAPQELVLEAELVMGTAGVSKRVERSGREFKIKSYQLNGGEFRLSVGGVTMNAFNDKQMKEISNPDLWHQKVQQYAEEISALYPVPFSAIRRRTLYFTSHMMSGADDTLTNQVTEHLMEQNPNEDAIILVAPDGFQTFWISLTPMDTGFEGYTPLTEARVHLIEKSRTARDLVAPHEIGHQDRFFGGGHVNGPMLKAGGLAGKAMEKLGDLAAWVTGDSKNSLAGNLLGRSLAHKLGGPGALRVEDGWDVRRVTSQQWPTRQGYNSLMAVTGPDAPNPWIDVQEYRKLMDVMVAGGRDPVMVLVAGVIWGPGDVKVADPLIYTGYPEPGPRSGPLRVEFFDGTGKKLGSRPVGLSPVIRSKKMEPDDSMQVGGVFRCASILPEGTARMVIRSDKQLLKEFTEGQELSLPGLKELRVSPDFSEAEIRVEAPSDARIRFEWVPEQGATEPLEFDPARSDRASGRYIVRLAEIPGKSAGAVRISATRGLRMVQTQSSKITPPSRPPSYVGCYMEQGPDGNMELKGMGYDPEDGFDLSYRWEDKNNKLVSTNRVVQESLFSTWGPGLHRLIVAGEDRDGHTLAIPYSLRCDAQGHLVSVERIIPGPSAGLPASRENLWKIITFIALTLLGLVFFLFKLNKPSKKGNP